LNILAVTESPSWIEPHILGSLREMGHEVCHFIHGTSVGEFYGRARAAERHVKNGSLLALAEEMHREDRLDLVFCYVYDDFLEVETAQALARLDVPMVNLNVDMANQWYRQTRTARYFTRILCAQRDNMDHLARYGAKTFHFPMAARVAREGDTAFEPGADVTFLGTPTSFRQRVLSEMEKAGIRLAVYGKYWDAHIEAAPDHGLEKTLSDLRQYGFARWRGEGAGALFQALHRRLKRPGPAVEQKVSDAARKGFLPEDALAALFRSSRINIGFTRMAGDDPAVPGLNQVKLRDFEVPAAGGFYLVEEAPGYAELFRPGEEIETWRTPDELIEKTRYYLGNEPVRQRIAEAGRRRAQAEHTWPRRFEGLCRELGLS